MSNPFSPESLAPTWVEATSILKEEEGHAFRGNQYTTGQSGGGSSTRAPREPAPRQADPNRNQLDPSRNADRDRKPGLFGYPDGPFFRRNPGEVRGTDLKPGSTADTKALPDNPGRPESWKAEDHRKASTAHLEAATDNATSMLTGNQRRANARASSLHARAAKVHDDPKSTPGQRRAASEDAIAASAVAEEETRRAGANARRNDLSESGPKSVRDMFQPDAEPGSFAYKHPILAELIPKNPFRAGGTLDRVASATTSSRIGKSGSDQPPKADDMSANPFAPENLTPTWVEATEILKGDTPGHAFRGNQYSQGHGGFANADSRSVSAGGGTPVSSHVHEQLTAQSMPLVRSAEGLTTHVGSVISPEQADRDAETHELIAEKHRQIADTLKGGDAAQQHQASVHEQAADSHEQAAYLLRRLKSGPTFSANVAEYKRVNGNAAMFSRVAGKLMFDVEGGDVERQLDGLHHAWAADDEDLQTAHELIAEQHGNRAEMLREMAAEERAAGRPYGDILERISDHDEAKRQHDNIAHDIAVKDHQDNPRPISDGEAMAGSLEAGRASDNAAKTAR